ncbi:MAG: NADH-quinone oxidoreductase subunit C [Acidimicrobiia bacterium]|nr:NADH-quinone oxidoreductase subunit C [Acidimicrobiia bacterium]MXZ07214.1 NADH-quinone oxidoreductase subunit C [Acidimicrobiia bacterium]MYD03905.1 NADH-quinone oxidoreductase subunit C [Acidimicrobiia bacterium]MYH56084.1 NADH-quinone oxidoreductase subunit C [Acidimicrobiia bacterium]
MTDNPSEGQTTSDPVDPLNLFAEEVARAVDGQAEVAHQTAKVRVPSTAWKESLTIVAGDLGLGFLSWLSAVDWTDEVAVGDEPDQPVERHYELLCAVSNLTDGRLVLISTEIDHESPSIESVADVYPGANWHEREAAEMFGIEFVGHPDLTKLYLPDEFEGFPLRKNYPLLSREVKPWPGKVDVEEMPEEDGGPTTENPGS